MDTLMKVHLLATVSDITIDEVPTMTIVFIGFFMTTKLNPNPNQTKGYQTSAPSCPQIDGRMSKRLMYYAKTI